MLDVRLLAALDLHGVRGTAFRRRIILAEFAGSFCVGVAIGVWVATGSGSTGWRVFGAWVAGVGLNYLPLTGHALSLLRGNALARELEGVDVRRQLRRYSTQQFWLAVPLLFVALAAIQLRRRPSRS